MFFSHLMGVSTSEDSNRCRTWCARYGCACVCFIPATGEVLETYSVKHMFQILKPHLHFMSDEEKGNGGVFIVGDAQGNVYFYVWDNVDKERYICRCQKSPCLIAPFMFDYDIVKVRG